MLEISKILAKAKGQSMSDLYQQYNHDFLKEETSGITAGGVAIPTPPATRSLTEEELRYRESFLKPRRTA